MAITGCKWQVLARYFLTSGSWGTPQAAGLDMLEELLSYSQNEVASWPLRCNVLCKHPLTWSDLHVMSYHRVQRCRSLYSLKLQTCSVNWMWCIILKHVGSWVVCCDGCHVSHQYVKSWRNWVIVNDFTRLWSSEAQSRGKGKGKESVDILILNWKQTFALYDFCLYVNFSLSGRYS